MQLKNETGVLLPQGFGPQPGLVVVDGNFRIDNVPPGDYRLSITGMPEGFYLKEARIGETDVLNAPLHYRPTDTAVLDLLISAKVSAITGTATNAIGQPLPGALVVLIPTRNRERTELFRSVTADTAG